MSFVAPVLRCSKRTCQSCVGTVSLVFHPSGGAGDQTIAEAAEGRFQSLIICFLS